MEEIELIVEQDEKQEAHQVKEDGHEDDGDEYEQRDGLVEAQVFDQGHVELVDEVTERNGHRSNRLEESVHDRLE